jgi:ubiquinone/menaquinone biosynthesis C-methylase UbiE
MEAQPVRLFRRSPYRVVSSARGQKTRVDCYWSRHTVRSERFRSAEESLDYLEHRFELYPLFREFMGLWGYHEGETILDYGCGPGNDLVGFAVYAQPARVIGADVSPKALSLAARRLALHDLEPVRVELMQATDSSTDLPLPDECVDYVHSAGVLQHTSDPVAIMKDFRRVLAPTGRACVMVYNRESVWLHLYTAYVRMIRERAFAGLSIEEAFARNTDGEACPIARCYRTEEFRARAREAGFEATFRGGYLSRDELEWLARYRDEALASAELTEEHKGFLRELETDDAGLPIYRGYHAGVGGVYDLTPA